MTPKELYDYITAQITPEQALMKMLEAGLIQYEALKFDEAENAVHPLVIITMAASDMGWHIAMEADDESDVHGLTIGTDDYLNKMFSKDNTTTL